MDGAIPGHPKVHRSSDRWGPSWRICHYEQKPTTKCDPSSCTCRGINPCGRWQVLTQHYFGAVGSVLAARLRLISLCVFFGDP